MRFIVAFLFACSLLFAVGCAKKEEAPAPVAPEVEVTQPVKPEPEVKMEIPAPAKLVEPKVAEEAAEEKPADATTPVKE